MTTIIVWVMHYIPGLSLRCDKEAEIVGIDDYEMGEFAYDYVGLQQEVGGLEQIETKATNGGREPHHAEAEIDSVDNAAEKQPVQ
jgi:Amt family ammonium transporter